MCDLKGKVVSEDSMAERMHGPARIPITMCHGLNLDREPPFDAERFAGHCRIVSEMGFTSISYDQLSAWRRGEADLPMRPIMFDFDHPTKSIHHEIHPIMQDLGFRGNLFINTGPMEEMYSGPLPDFDARSWMTWEEIGRLMEAGWHIGAHTHTHPNLSELSTKDASGDAVRAELTKCDEILNRELGVEPRDFAFTGTSWSSAAEREVQKRYRFGRLWIVGAAYQADGREVRYADLAGIPGDDEANEYLDCPKRKGYELPDPVEEDIFEMSEEDRAGRGIASLPGDLAEAIAVTEKSELVREALGDHIFEKFVENKKIEWDNYRKHVSQYELDKYLPVL